VALHLSPLVGRTLTPAPPRAAHALFRPVFLRVRGQLLG
jgi:hypothetical protein